MNENRKRWKWVRSLRVDPQELGLDESHNRISAGTDDGTDSEVFDGAAS